MSTFVARAILSTVDDNHIWLCLPVLGEPGRITAAVNVISLKIDFRYPESRLAKLFNGSIPIVLDSLKQHYFIDRDGGMFRHILNFMRNSRLLIPENFADLDLLLEESRYFDIARGGGGRGGGGDTDNHQQSPHHEGYECVALHISPDLGERIMLSGERALLDEVFPETNQALLDARSSVAWNQHDTRHVIRFPLNGYCKLNSVQAITRLLNAGFRVAASNGGGVEGQQFSEYLFVRKVFPVYHGYCELNIPDMEPIGSRAPQGSCWGSGEMKEREKGGGGGSLGRSAAGSSGLGCWEPSGQKGVRSGAGDKS
uniref:Potassium channel tetramerisation-type BTB domain-containing protein n=1 Tax=Timema douglasi TaxID=61478 RepID=A0A7R8VQD0_TIMDO|nr:unnamed protein product [Timema douglasi]